MQWTVRLEARTDQGEVETTELVTLNRLVVDGSLAELGLALSEAKAVLAKLQATMVQSQVAEYAACHRVCPQCRVPQPLKDQRARRLQTLFGTVEVEAPRFRVCRCRPLAPTAAVTLSPVCALLTARCTPELERVQAELGARTSFREAARILEALLPASPANHESVRNRTHVAARQLEAADQRAAVTVVVGDMAAAGVIQPTVMLDGAYARAVPGHQVRNFEVICGKVEHGGRCSRRFPLVRSVAEQPHALLRAALLDQGWWEGSPVTVISDGDPALPVLVRSAAKAPMEPILDWFHLSMRVRHVERTLLGLCALEPVHRAPLEHARVDVERLRHPLWNGYHGEACQALGRIVSWLENAAFDGAAVVAKAGRLIAHCTELRGYIENNGGALIDYGQRYRAGKPISTSRAEGTVNHLVNARMNKRRQMRWSPQGAHRVLQVRAAVLDGRFGQQAIQLAA
ncbi:MAG TPA: ISKra4 family transposase [Armatimonadota bacterium]|nr:ISKra4 family transposase [Armatimonadota bacterium]